MFSAASGLNPTRNLRHFMGPFYEEGGFVLSVGAYALVGIVVCGEAQTFKRNEETLEGYLRVFEKENMRVLVKKGVNEREVRDAANQNYEAMMRRGRQFAPNVDVKLLETKEAVEKELRVAVQLSEDVDALLKTSPSFAAWF